MAKKPCILVGRCSNEILKDADISYFHVFLYADEEVRIECCMKQSDGRMNYAQMKKYAEHKDEMRGRQPKNLALVDNLCHLVYTFTN